jgi:hypothetical protein
MKLVVCLVALCLIAGVILYALRYKGDVKAAFKMPFVEFSLETKDRSPAAGSDDLLPKYRSSPPDSPPPMIPSASESSRRPR